MHLRPEQGQMAKHIFENLIKSFLKHHRRSVFGSLFGLLDSISAKPKMKPPYESRTESQPSEEYLFYDDYAY